MYILSQKCFTYTKSWFPIFKTILRVDSSYDYDSCSWYLIAMYDVLSIYIDVLSNKLNFKKKMITLL